MKIIQVIPTLGTGGAEIMCENLTYELIKMGHTVIVVSLFDEETTITQRLTENGVDIRYMGKKLGLDLSLFGKLKRLFKQEKPDAVHTHLYASKYAFVAAKRAKVKRVVHTLHSIAVQESPKSTRIVNGFFFKHGGVTPAALSKLVQNTIVEEYGLLPESVPVIHNGVSLTNCIAKTDYHIDDRFKILHIGRFVEVKNHVGMVNAFKRFHEKFPQSELHLVGDGNTKESIEQLVQQYGLSSAVIFHGAQKNVFGFLHEADIFTLPSLYEGMPMTLIEAMGTGVPIVATAVGGVPDMLDDQSAQLIPVDEAALSEAWENYYTNKELRVSHGICAKEKAQAFSSEMMAKEYYKLYKLKEF